jgi:hypothetical protein
MGSSFRRSEYDNLSYESMVWDEFYGSIHLNVENTSLPVPI